jgi:hypothetical protein
MWDFPECPFIFPRKENHIECLPLEDVGKGQYSEGHFANMISAASDYDTVSSSSIPYSDGNETPDDRGDSNSSFDILSQRHKNLSEIPLNPSSIDCATPVLDKSLLPLSNIARETAFMAQDCGSTPAMSFPCLRSSRHNRGCCYQSPMHCGS